MLLRLLRRTTLSHRRSHEPRRSLRLLLTDSLLLLHCLSSGGLLLKGRLPLLLHRLGSGSLLLHHLALRPLRLHLLSLHR